MSTINNSLLNRKKNLGIPLSYFLTIFFICITPTVLAILKIDYNSLFYPSVQEIKIREHQNIGSVFNSIWLLFSIATGIFAFTLSYFDFKIKKDVFTPLIGIILICIAVIDMLHLLISESAIILKIPFKDGVYISWLIGRFLNAIFLIIGTGLFLFIRFKWIRRFNQKVKFLYIISVSFLLITFTIIFGLFSINQTPTFLTQKTGFIRHSAEIYSVILFLVWGALIMPRFVKNHPSILSKLLLLCMIPAIFSALHMSVSVTPFDLDYNIAQFLKLFTFIIPLIGIGKNYSQNISKQYQQNLNLDKQIQEREKIQKDLENKQALLKHAEEIANMGSWELKLSNKEMVWSDSLFKLFDVSPLTVKPNLASMLKLVALPYRNELERIIKEAEKSNESFIYEYQISTASGETRHIQGQGQYISENKKIIGTCLDITKLKETNSKLKQNEALLKEAESISHNGSFEWFQDSDTMFWSDELYRIHGFKPNSIKIDAGFYRTLIHPDDIDRCQNVFEKAIELNKNFSLEYRIIRPNNEIRFIYGNSRFFKQDNGILKIFGTLQDITDLKNTTILLEKTESIYKTIAKNVPDSAVMMFDREYNLILFEGPIVNHFSFKTLPTIGLNIKDLYNSTNYQKIKNLLDKAFLGEEIKLEKELNNRYFKISYIPVKNANQEIFNVMIVKQDISEIKAAQENLESKIDELNRSNQDLEQFAYVASHDLQEPLRKIRAFGDRLQNKFSKHISEEGLDYIHRMQNASERMQILIDDLLTYSKVTRGEETLEQVDLHEQIQRVLEDLEFTIEKKNATIDILVNHKINAIPGQIRQLFQNIISNAIKFTKEDVAPLVEIKSEILRGELIPYDNINPSLDYCKITIKDNGIGFEEQYSNKIFALFQRLHTRNEYKGTGIGLAVCKKIVEQHKGQIHVTSKPDEGTTFTIVFPLA